LGHTFSFADDYGSALCPWGMVLGDAGWKTCGFRMSTSAKPLILEEDF
jgi:hypothetical protein